MQFTTPVSGARARSIPVFHVDIRLYAIGSTDVRRTYVGHEKVMEITTMWGSLRLAPISLASQPYFSCGGSLVGEGEGKIHLDTMDGFRIPLQECVQKQ